MANSGGDRGELRLLRRVGEPDHVPDGAAGAVERGGGGGRERLDGHRHPHAAARGLRRRFLARPLPLHHPRLHALRPGNPNSHSSFVDFAFDFEGFFFYPGGASICGRTSRDTAVMKATGHVKLVGLG